MKRRSIVPVEMQRDVFDAIGWIVAASLSVLALAHAGGQFDDLISSAIPVASIAWLTLVVLSLVFGAVFVRVSGRIRNPWRGTLRALAWIAFVIVIERCFAAKAVVIAVALALLSASFSRRSAEVSTRASILYLFALLATIVAFAMLADGWTLSAFFVQSALCGSFLAREHARSVRSRLAQRRTSVPMQPEDFRPPRAASVRGAFAATLIAACALAITAEVARWWRAHIDSTATSDVARAQQRSADRRATQPRWRGEVEFGGAPDAATAERIRAMVTVRDVTSGSTWTDGRPLYLTLHHLDRVTEQGVRNSDPARVTLRDDASDGDDDGWIVVRTARGAPMLELDIEQEELITSRDGSALLRYEPLLAVSGERALYDPDVALLRLSNERMHRYTLICNRLQPAVAKHTSVRARHLDPRFVQLPSLSPALERVSTLARELARGATNDRERVDRILDHLLSFEYSLAGAKGTGMKALLDFLERRSGSCEAFASTATVLLRSLGISTRLVTGFLATEFDDESARYVLRQRHAHAWIEVYFERVGWVRFEPTPSSSAPSADASEAAQRDELAIWSSNLLESARSFVFAQPEAPSVIELGLEVAQAPRVWFESVRARQRSGQIIGGVLIVGLLAWLARSMRGRLKRSNVIPPAVVAARRHEDRLLDALRQRGHVRGATQTLREFAERVLDREGPEARGLELERAVAVIDAARWGAVEFTHEHRELLERVVARCEALFKESRGLEPA